MLQLLIVTGRLGLGKGEVVSQWSVAEEPLDRLNPADKRAEQKRGGLGTDQPGSGTASAGLGPVIPVVPENAS